MKLQHLPNGRARRAFTLIEMIGVLAVIAILAALLVPKIFEAINSARVNNAVVSYNTIKTAAMDHYGKYGKFDTISGSTAITAPFTNYDSRVLLVEGLIDKPFDLKVGTNAMVMMRAGVAGTNAVDGVNAGYWLSGQGSSVNEAGGAQYVLDAIIQGVAEADAIAISDRLDGPNLTATTGNADLRGRVKYATPVSGVTDVYLYIAHR